MKHFITVSVKKRHTPAEGSSGGHFKYTNPMIRRFVLCFFPRQIISSKFSKYSTYIF